MFKFAECPHCNKFKLVSHFYVPHPDIAFRICKVCMSKGKPTLVPAPASLAAGIASVIEQIGKMRGEA